jgi:ribosomal protein L40E
MAKFKEAEARLIKNKYVCRVCKAVTKSPPMKVLNGEVKCKKCSSKYLRPKRRK